MNEKYTWGDSVKVTSNAPEKFLLNKAGEICGISEVRTVQESDHWGYPVGTIIYTVEFSEGNSEEIPEQFLESLT